MNDDNKIAYIIMGTFVGLLLLFIVWILFFFDTSGNSSSKSNVKVTKNDTPALTLKKDKEDQKAEAAKKAEEEKKKEEESKKDKDKKNKKENNKSKEKTGKKDVKALKKEAEDNVKQFLDVQSKTKDDFKKPETQALFKDVATKNYVENHNDSGSSNDAKIQYKNIKLKLDNDEDLKKDKAHGIVQFDRLTKPKDKKSKTKANTEINQKYSITFKKEDGKLKIDKQEM